MWINPFEICDVMLGIQWLERVEVVKWDFKNQIMDFEYKAQVKLLKGASPKNVKNVGSTAPLKDLHKCGQLIMIQICEQE